MPKVKDVSLHCGAFLMRS